MKFFEDKTKHQALFWFGPGTNVDNLHVYTTANRLNLSADIGALWTLIGTGTVFESEDIFALEADPVTGESAISITNWYRENGLPNDFLVLHRGLGGLTVLDMRNDLIHVIDEDSFTPTNTFLSFDDWYCGHLRPEYAERYGMA